MTSLAMFLYLTIVRPYKDNIANKLAIANELFLAIFVACIVGVQHIDAGDKLGWALITLMSSAIGLNVAMMLRSAYINFRARGSHHPDKNNE